jgi:hypothetical protein
MPPTAQGRLRREAAAIGFFLLQMGAHVSAPPGVVGPS